MELICQEHTSYDTALIIENFYGYKNIRYWINYRHGGFRFMHQTTNKYNEKNKPVASDYFRVAMAMYKNDKGHVKFAGLDTTANYDQAMNFKNLFYDGIPGVGQAMLDTFIEHKKKQR